MYLSLLHTGFMLKTIRIVGITMANLSQNKRMNMIEFLHKILEKNEDDSTIAALNEIESALNGKKYGLVWERHEENVDITMKTHIPVFTEVIEKEIVTSPNSKYNFLLEGDNLHSLKLLEKTHRNRVDIIYIDPPYNHGGDFIYNDNYIDKTDAFMHSKWLSFMHERLRIARNLLSKDGLIFISIDDDEVAQLKLLCDEIFGSENFINQFIWQKKSSVKTDKTQFTVNTEYILLYSKSQEYILGSTYKPLASSTIQTYNKDDNDGRGKYATVSLQKPRDPGPETTYDYVDNTGKIWKCPMKGWRMKYSEVKKLENDHRLIFSGKTLRVKDYWNERESEGKRIDTLWNDLPENAFGSSELDKILGKKGMFDNPKPVGLIKRCIDIGKKNALVLDFFAGSGTTAQAVQQLNLIDGGGRHFILCTNNQNDICTNVTYPRIYNVISGYTCNSASKTELYQKKLGLSDLKNMGEILNEIDKIKSSNGSRYNKITVALKDGIISVNGEVMKNEQVKGIPANLKYYKTDFVAKDSSSVRDELLQHIIEMVQLEQGVKIDGKQYVLILNDEDADELEAHWLEHAEIRALYVSSEVLLTANQLRIFNNVEMHIIPDYYFNFELREIGELC